jgi:hypothetical protein
LPTTLILLVPLLVYFWTLAPTVHWRDAGELAAAAATLGIPHPPGRPLYVLLGWLATRLPLGDAAYRLNLLSAIAGAAAVGVLVAGARRAWAACRPEGGEKLPALPAALATAGGAWAFAFGTPAWTWSTVVENYTLLACLAGGALVLMLPEPSHGSRPLAPVALCFGLALAVHPAALFAVPALGLALATGLVALPRRAGEAGRSLAAVLVGLALYAYIPVRSATGPMFDWEAARSLEEVWYYLVAGQYRYAGGPLGAPPLAALPERFWRVGVILWDEWGPASLALSALGAGLLLWRAPAVGLTVELFTLGFFFLPTLAPTFESARVMTGYRLPGLWGLGLLAAVGGLGLASGVVGWMGRAGSSARAVLAVASAVAAVGLVAPVARGASGLPIVSQRGVSAPRAYGEALLRGAPPGAIILVAHDDPLFVLWYLRTVEGMRRDVAVLPASWLGARRRVLARWHPELTFPTPAEGGTGAGPPDIEAAAAFIRANAGRHPILFAPPLAIGGLQGRIVPRGALGEYAPEGARPDDRRLHAERLARFGAAVVPPALVPGDVEGRLVLSRHLEAVARFSGRHGWHEEAILAAMLARQLVPDQRDVLLLLVALYRETNRLPAAVALAEELGRRERDAPDILKTLADLYHAAGDPARAIGALEALVRARPDERQARLNLALLYAEAGRRAEARAQLEAILRQNPEDREARRRLEALGGS